MVRRVINEHLRNVTLAMNGSPHMLIVYDPERGKVNTEVTTGFDYDFAFKFLKKMAKEDNKFRDVLVNFVIEVSQEV